MLMTIMMTAILIWTTIVIAFFGYTMYILIVEERRNRKNRAKAEESISRRGEKTK